MLDQINQKSDQLEVLKLELLKLEKKVIMNAIDKDISIAN